MVVAITYKDPITLATIPLPVGTATLQPNYALKSNTLVFRDSTSTLFNRTYKFSFDGNLISFTDTTLGGASYTPIGAISVAGGDATAANQLSEIVQLTAINISSATSASNSNFIFAVLSNQTPNLSNRHVTILSGGTATKNSGEVITYGYNSTTGDRLTLSELAIFGIGVNATAATADEKCFLSQTQNGISSSSFQTINRTNIGANPSALWTNPNAFTITLVFSTFTP